MADESPSQADINELIQRYNTVREKVNNASHVTYGAVVITGTRYKFVF